MNQLEMRTLDNHYDQEDAEGSAQERLLYNNNYNSQQLFQPHGQQENPYQLPYAHLHQTPYLHHQQMLQQQQSSYSSDDHSSIYSPRPLNGHGVAYAQNTLPDKYSVAYPVRDDQIRRGQKAGSGSVYRSKRKLYCIAAVLSLLLLVLAGSVVAAVYFTVLRKDSDSAALAEAANKSGIEHKSQYDDSPATKLPFSNIPVVSTTPFHLPLPKSNHNPDFIDIRVHKFDAYWHPGDSRLFVSTLTNGTMIQVFGPKKSDGTVKSMYALSVTDISGVTRSIRFPGQRNLATVILPSGVIVSYDWSANNIDMEIKVFEPYTEQTKGPISHLALVEVGVRSYLLRQVSKVMEDMRSLREDPMSGSRRSNSRCFSRFPVMVTKCGGQYPYDGAFVQGVITGMEKPITMTALPWPKEADPCYDLDGKTATNYYLPLPGHIDPDNATTIKEAYVASSARLFSDICNIINDQVFQEHHSLCSDMGDKVRKKLGRHQLLGIVFDSCTAILTALHTACVAISSVSAGDSGPGLTENVLLRSFTRRLTDSFQMGPPELVDLRAHAFCPSSLPMSSYQSIVNTNNIRGGVIQEVININCPDYPEVTYVDLDHLLAKSDAQAPSGHFDVVKHKMRMCSICAFEKSVTVQIVSDEMLCNNTCLKTNVLEHIPDHYPKEDKNFTEEDSVYCHDFLTSVENSIEPFGRQCLGNCMSHLHARFQIMDPKDNVMYYDQTVQCSELRAHACKMKIGK